MSVKGGSLTRRQFLRLLGSVAGAVLGASLLDDLQASPPPRKPLQVIIAGAGLAGLCAAYELEKRGHSVTILEAEPRHIGGRARTLRFSDGLYGEAGAMRIPLRHELTRHYANEFKLPLRRFVQSNPEAYYYVRGRKERIKDVKRITALFALREAEQRKTPEELWSEVVSRPLRNLSEGEKADLLSDAPVTEAIRQLDRQSLMQLFQASGLSREAIELAALTSGAETFMYSAGTEIVREELREVWSREFHEIIGGTDRLPAAFAERLGSKPRPGCEVVRFEQYPLRHRVAAVYRDRLKDGQPERVEGDLLLCTLPLPALDRLQVDPLFSGAKRRAIRELRYDSATKVLLVSRKRFWETEEGIFGGGTFTDLPSGTAYYPSDNAEAKDPQVSAGPGVLLASYTWGQQARRLAALPHPERADLVVQNLSHVHPQLGSAGMVQQTASWNWDTHPWSGGAFAWFLPGQYSTLHRDAISREGRIFFAGEHASLSHSWMQGAFESALRAVREMLASG